MKLVVDRDGHNYYRCSDADCKEMMEVPESVRMRAAGAPELPGLDDPSQGG